MEESDPDTVYKNKPKGELQESWKLAWMGEY